MGPKLAEGRDSEIYEHGPGRVLRLARDGRTLEREAKIMTYARRHGYPVPEVHDAGPGFLVMDRLNGPTMMDQGLRRPYLLPRLARLLASLHGQLHAISAPDWLPEAAVPGDRLLHRDLHPLNVLMTDGGPMVIDWANAARGDPAYDVADTWTLFATAQAPGGWAVQGAAAVGRRLFLRRFLKAVDSRSARAAIPLAVENRLTDRNMSEAEKARMRRLAAWAVG